MLLQKCFQTDIIFFFYQGTVSAIKFRKRLAKFKITIGLTKKFGSKGLLRQLNSLRFIEALANLISWDCYDTKQTAVQADQV